MLSLYPSKTALRWIRDNGCRWSEVARDLVEPQAVMPLPDSSTRRRLVGADFTGYVEPIVGDDGEDALLLVGVANRDKAAADLSEAVVGIEAPVKRSSRRGGSGRRWPTTWRELVERLCQLPGVVAEQGRTHLIVTVWSKRVASLPCTSSDHRALMNACTHLKRLGLDVSRKPARDDDPYRDDTTV